MLLEGPQAFSQYVTVNGTMVDAGGNIATSGTVVFTIQPQASGVLYFIQGTSTIASQTVTCAIQSDGSLKNSTSTGSCQVAGNDVISPANTLYQAQFYPGKKLTNTIGQLLITTAHNPYNLNTPIFGPQVQINPQYQTLSIGPAQANVYPATDGVFSLGLSGYRWSTAYINSVILGADPTLALQAATKQYVDNVTSVIPILPLPTAGQILVGNAGGNAYAPKALNGDGTLDSNGKLTLNTGVGTTLSNYLPLAGGTISGSLVISGTLSNGSGAPPLLASSTPPSGHQAMSPTDLNSGLLPATFTLFRGAVDATTYTGADACAKINSAIASLPAPGGIIDARGFGNTTQIVSTTCNTSATVSGTQRVELLFSPSTTYIPATTTTTIIAPNPNTSVTGLTIDASGVAGYTGHLIAYLQRFSGDDSIDSLSHAKILLPAGSSGDAIYISPTYTSPNGIAGLRFSDITINGGGSAFHLVALSAATQYINGNQWINVWVKNAAYCLNLDGSGAVGNINSTVISGNVFHQVQCQSGPNSVNAIKMQNASQNFFDGVNAWDYNAGVCGACSPSSLDANSAFNFWRGIGSSTLAFIGTGNNYYDLQGDNVSASGLHINSFSGGGLNGSAFLGTKFIISKNSTATGWEIDPTQTGTGSTSGLNFITPGVAGHTYINGTYVSSDNFCASAGAACGVTVSGTSCTITAITGGIITGAHCP